MSIIPFSVVLSRLPALFLLSLIVSLFSLAGGCKPSVNSPVFVSSTAPEVIRLEDVTASSGIHFTHNNGAFGAKWTPETVGSGVVFIDYNRDDYQDIFFINSRDWTESEVVSYQKGKWASQEATDYMKSRGLKRMVDAEHVKPVPTNRPRHNSTSKLYRNNKDGTFTDVTKGSGLDLEIYGMGAAVGDYDNDGRPDLYVTALNRNHLFHNKGNGKFEDVASRAGVQAAGWSSNAAWFDYDKDGRLDLFVGHYLKWSPATDYYSAIDSKKIYSGPGRYKGDYCRLYRNLGSGKFADVSARAGIRRHTTAEGKVEELQGKVLGVAICDYNNDTWPDVFVANDKQRNYLFKNNGKGTFTEVAVALGVAFSEQGKMRAGMGVDVADVDNSGHLSIVIGNFSDEMIGLYKDQGGVFVDTAPRSEVGRASMGFLTFGVSFVDVDNDSWLDIAVANGHIDDHVKEITGNIEYAQRPLLFHNEGGGDFKEIGEQTGEAMKKPIVARGLAYADIELDGDADLVFTTSGGPALLLRNEGGNKNNWVRLVLQGTKSNRSAIGAKVEAKVGTATLRRMVRSGSSYLSQSELPVTVGLGHHQQVDSLNVTWPSGKVTRLEHLQANRLFLIDEDKGIVRTQPMTRTDQTPHNPSPE